MRMWVDWALWQKLSIVLAVLIVVVLIYSFGILVYNRRVIKKQAAAEANEKMEQETELHPMLTDTSYIPFGARALERGIETEGIWVSNSNSPVPSPPHHPSTPIRSFPPSPTHDWPLKKDPVIATSEVKMPTVAHPMAFHIKSPEAQRNPRVGIDNGARDKRREGFPHDQFRATRYPHLVAAGRNEPHAADEPELHPSKKNRRSSWIRSPEILKRAPVIERHHRRTSSEEFRRRMSKLFDENVQLPPMEEFQLNPLHKTPTHYRRNSGLDSPPS